MTSASLREVMLAQIKERPFQRQVIEWMRRYGWELISANNDSRSIWWATDRGLPDLIAVRPPRLLFAELKTEHVKRGNEPAHQQRWLRALQRCHGVEAYCWRPSDELDIKRILT
jgi:hypothetical protein